MAERFYEAMFLVDSAKADSQFDEIVRHISSLIQRHDARIERIEKWEERKLSYPISGTERGTYILVYFHVDSGQVAQMRREVQLSEQILRVLIVKCAEVSPVKGELYDSDGNVIGPREQSPEEEPEPA